jgi:hypothetical protein
MATSLAALRRRRRPATRVDPQAGVAIRFQRAGGGWGNLAGLAGLAALAGLGGLGGLGGFGGLVGCGTAGYGMGGCRMAGERLAHNTLADPGLRLGFSNGRLTPA